MDGVGFRIPNGRRLPEYIVDSRCVPRHSQHRCALIGYLQNVFVRRHAELIVVVSAILLSAVAAAHLISAKSRIASQLQTLRVGQARATLITTGGSLTGWSSINGLEWQAVRTDVSRHSYGHVVLFPVSQAGEVGDLKFWRDVALRSKAKNPTIQFVALCLAPVTCQSLDGGADPLILLTAMDPLQIRAIEAARSKSSALIYRANGFIKSVSIAPADALASEIVATFIDEQ